MPTSALVTRTGDALDTSLLQNALRNYALTQDEMAKGYFAEHERTGDAGWEHLAHGCLRDADRCRKAADKIEQADAVILGYEDQIPAP